MNKEHENYMELYTEQLSVISDLKSEITTLKEQLEWFKRQIFGQKSERYTELPPTAENLPGFIFAEAEGKAEEETVLYSKKKSKKRNKGTCTLELPDDIPVEETVKDLPEDERIHPETEEELSETGRESVDKPAYRPGSYFIKRTTYVKYAVPGNALSGIIQPDTEDSLIRGSKFDESFMAHLVTEKLAYHTPLYRMQEKLSFGGIKIERRTLSSLIKNLGNRMEPLYNEMKKVLFESSYLFTDDTPVKMLSPGAGKTKETRMWIYQNAGPNAPPYILYEFTQNRNYEHPDKFLRGFNGTVHADAFGAYVNIDADKHIPVLWSACRAHARRKIDEAKAGDIKLKHFLMGKIQQLFMYERDSWKADARTRLRIRQEKEKHLVDEIFDTLKEKLRTDIMPPKEKLTIAVKYLLRYEVNFRRYLDDPNLRMDNNTAEHSIRKVVIGKKNWMFIGSPSAGKSMGILYSLVQTCRAVKVDPQKYLEDIFRRIMSHPHKNLRELLPDQWKQKQEITAK